MMTTSMTPRIAVAATMPHPWRQTPHGSARPAAGVGRHSGMTRSPTRAAACFVAPLGPASRIVATMIGFPLLRHAFVFPPAVALFRCRSGAIRLSSENAGKRVIYVACRRETDQLRYIRLTGLLPGQTPAKLTMVRLNRVREVWACYVSGLPGGFMVGRGVWQATSWLGGPLYGLMLMLPPGMLARAFGQLCRRVLTVRFA